MSQLVCVFDFNHKQSVTPEQIARVEQRVRGWIADDFQGENQEMPIAAAKAAGAKALFGEKYGDVVRVVDMGGPDVSIELCGGSHVASTADIGAFAIEREESTSGWRAPDLRCCWCRR